MRTHFLVDGFISSKPAFDMQPDGVFDQLAGLFLGFSLGVAALERGANGHKPSVLVLLNNYSELVILHRRASSEILYPFRPVLTSIFSLLPPHKPGLGWRMHYGPQWATALSSPRERFWTRGRNSPMRRWPTFTTR